MNQSIVYKGHLISARKRTRAPFDYYAIVYADDKRSGVLARIDRDEYPVLTPKEALDIACYQMDKGWIEGTADYERLP
jgi:hypothetical protein